MAAVAAIDAIAAMKAPIRKSVVDMRSSARWQSPAWHAHIQPKGHRWAAAVFSHGLRRPPALPLPLRAALR